MGTRGRKAGAVYKKDIENAQVRLVKLKEHIEDLKKRFAAQKKKP
jgi:hypothetical protein